MIGMTYRCSNNSCFFEDLPFYWHPLESSNDNIFSETLPFELIYDDSRGLLRQKPRAEVTAALTSAYNRGSDIVGLMDSEGMSLQYTEDFLTFLDDATGLRNIAGKGILEIGCGTGYLLHRLQQLDGVVTGCEPGWSQIGKYDVPVIEDFFPSEAISDKTFDVIIACALLEHLENIDGTLSAVCRHLKESGIFVVSVPDCEECITNGDISMLLHEHFSYFTGDSFRATVETICLAEQKIRRSDFGGFLYGSFVKDNHPKIGAGRPCIVSKNAFGRIEKNVQLVRDFIAGQRNRTLGVYVPIRALNVLSLCADLIREANVSLRFFDDSPTLIGKYLPGFDIRIENRRSLIETPPDVILIYTYSFGNKIAEELREVLPRQVEIYGIADLQKVC